MSREASPPWCTGLAGTGVFPPQQGEDLVELVHQDPATHGIARSRWRRIDLRACLPWLADYTLSGVGKALVRLGLRPKRGRLRQHSPDPEYATKVARLARALHLARTSPTRVTLVSADEAGFARQPTLGRRWGCRGEEPTAELAAGPDLTYRLAGGVDAVQGQVTWLSGLKVGVGRLKTFLRKLRKLRRAYPDRYLFLVWDNWPVHTHEAVLAVAKAERIRILWLPTYAPWTNPSEKLWRWLKQTGLHHHRQAHDWPGLKAAVFAFLDRFATASPDLVRYVGLATEVEGGTD